ncbi:uncharacterized protein LOC144159874 [Haemaphysalis longicornis]
MSLRGVLVGHSQLKFLCRLRLRLLPFVETCTFSFGGHNTPRLSEAVSRLRCRPADFAVLYVGGNNLDRTGADPQRICDSIKALVTQLQREVAPAVYVFTVLPRCFQSASAGSTRRLLNRKLTATPKRMRGVYILNAEHRFLNATKQPKRSLFAADGYHVSRDRGIDEMSAILVKALARRYGRGILSPDRAAPGAKYTFSRCVRCGAKGHERNDCLQYCSPS